MQILSHTNSFEYDVYFVFFLLTCSLQSTCYNILKTLYSFKVISLYDKVGKNAKSNFYLLQRSHYAHKNRKETLYIIISISTRNNNTDIIFNFNFKCFHIFCVFTETGKQRLIYCVSLLLIFLLLSFPSSTCIHVNIIVYILNIVYMNKLPFHFYTCLWFVTTTTDAYSGNLFLFMMQQNGGILIVFLCLLCFFHCLSFDKRNSSGYWDRKCFTLFCCLWNNCEGWFLITTTWY